MGNIADLISAGLVPPERIEVSLSVPYDEIAAVYDLVFEVMDLNEEDADVAKLDSQRFELLGNIAERMCDWRRNCSWSRRILPPPKVEVNAMAASGPWGVEER